MSLFEFFGETVNPGEMGSIKPSDKRYKPKNVWIIILGIISLSLTIAFSVFVIQKSSSIDSMLISFLFSFLYLILAFRIQFRIPQNNIGWFGTPIDNPFRISDDYNRVLLLLQVILLPGKLISTSLFNLFTFLRRK